MKLKNIGEKVQDKIRKLAEENEEKTPEELLKEQVIKPIEGKKLSEEEKRKKQAENLVTVLQENPEMQQTIVEEAANSEQISQDVIDKSAQIAAESSKVPDKVTGTLVEKASDEATVDILKNEGIDSREIRIGVIDSIEDQNKREQAICGELEKLYKASKELQPGKGVTQKIQDILDKLGENKRTDKINEVLYKTIAKVFAIEYNNYNGSMKIYAMEKFVPIDEMIRAKMPQLIEKEYRKIGKERTIKANKKREKTPREKTPFDLEKATQIFLNQMAMEVTGAAKKEHKSDSAFMKNLGDLTESELTYLTGKFLDLNPEIGTIELEKIVKIAKGEIKEPAQNSRDVPVLQKMQEEDLSLRELISQNTDNTLGNEDNDTIKVNESTEEQKTEQKVDFDLSALGKEEIEAIKQCMEAGLIENLAKVPEDKRKKMIKAINNSLEERTKTNPTLETSEVGKTEELKTEKMPNKPEDKQEGYEIGD